jgi:hypothetical protein
MELMTMPFFVAAFVALLIAPFPAVCTSPEKTDTKIWLTNTVSGLTRTLHFIQGRNPA